MNSNLLNVFIIAEVLVVI